MIFFENIYVYKSKFLIWKLTFITSSYFSIKAGVPQGRDLSPDIIFNIYIDDILVTTNTTMVTYADVTTILYVSDDPDETSNLLKVHLN